MCEFVSFIIGEDESLYFGDLFNHSSIEEYNKNPEKYHECEWTSNEPSILEVRVNELSKQNKSFFESSILGRFSTRIDLLKYVSDNDLSKTKITVNDEGLHSFDDLPAIVWANGNQHWYKDGKRHRDNDLPAIVRANGDQHWYKDGKLYRDNDLPAVVYANGDQYWYKDGKFYSSHD